jgi:hypothetical protein
LTVPQQQRGRCVSESSTAVHIDVDTDRKHAPLFM